MGSPDGYAAIGSDAADRHHPQSLCPESSGKATKSEADAGVVHIGDLGYSVLVRELRCVTHDKTTTGFEVNVYHTTIAFLWVDEHPARSTERQDSDRLGSQQFLCLVTMWLHAVMAITIQIQANAIKGSTDERTYGIKRGS
jgi:hypothetical protein